ncbi:RNA-binding S4 domain-containing protein [Pseudorhodoplanes sinuspersici]|uniref:Uncharacterized protein n=1 Tax=Pseudorhodoplanes sinuspersici TaxID=1235591 RepID=A0A1W6ZQ05_9HYPH|nr:hypothetical protein CAK95_10540 [Pseudorhodoplanes sinuspersici]RKE70425.1 ribosomal 50S subunit-recycling heat shock protein [Pseudorhodoplanes sinuspersici]
MDRQRIDKWLWHARVVRTRTAAAGLVGGGLIRINGARIDAASRAVRIGDVVTIAFDTIKILKVTGFSERRGSATDATLLYEDLQVVAPVQQGNPTVEPEAATRRPNKRERRDIVRLKRPDNDH